ncbi:Scn10a [Symbiodinium sp. CCMP2456]|nr:Scn10a [Symbiodinium sp. CCMP2456]
MACCASEQILDSTDCHESWERDDLILQSSSQRNSAQSRPMACCTSEQVLASADSPDSWDRDDLKEMIRQNHEILMRELYKQQEALYKLHCWSQDVPLLGRPRATSKSHSMKKAPTANSRDAGGDSELVQVEVESESPGFSPSSRLAKKVQAKTGANKKKDANPEQTFRGRLRSFVADGPLDVLAGFIILVNAIVLMVEMQIRAGYAQEILGISFISMYPTIPQTVDRPEIFETIEYIFLAFYVCEMLTRVVVLRKSWFYTAEEGLIWGNYFDAMIVVFGVVDVLVQKVALPQEGETHFGAVLLRLLKVFKLTKTLRLVRVMQLFAQLRSMVDTFFASLSSLFWSMIMLLVCMLIAALILCESVVPLIVETSTTIGIDRREWLFIRYGSFFRAMYTMFEITFSGGWPGLVRPLVDEVSVLFVIPTLIYVVAIVFAALRLITALFVRSTMQVLNDDAAAAILERMRRSAELQDQLHRDKLLQVFNDADADGDGYLTLKEFERMLTLPEIKHYLSVLDMDVRDARMLFHLLDDGDDIHGALSVQEFCEGIAKVRGNAKSADMVLLLHETGKVRKECQAAVRVQGLWLSS